MRRLGNKTHTLWLVGREGLEPMLPIAGNVRSNIRNKKHGGHSPGGHEQSPLAVWSKRRILEIYLNIAEWGPGVYGAEAAARYHFNKSAARLTPDEAALLAAALPDPLGRDAGNPGSTTSRLAARLRKRMDSGPDVRCLSLRVQRVREPEGKSKSAR